MREQQEIKDFALIRERFNISDNDILKLLYPSKCLRQRRKTFLTYLRQVGQPRWLRILNAILKHTNNL